MEILAFLIPVTLFIGAVGLAAFIWALKSHQFEDPKGDANRILTTDWDHKPKP